MSVQASTAAWPRVCWWGLHKNLTRAVTPLHANIRLFWTDVYITIEIQKIVKVRTVFPYKTFVLELSLCLSCQNQHCDSLTTHTFQRLAVYRTNKIHQQRKTDAIVEKPPIFLYINDRVHAATTHNAWNTCHHRGELGTGMSLTNIPNGQTS